MSNTNCQENSSKKPLRFTMSLRLWKDEKAFGPGMVQLLKNIEQFQSLRTATAEMNIAYSKAWKMLKKCEEELGFPFLERQVGGVKGGGSSLTKEGKEFLDRYVAFEKEAEQATANIFTKYFENY